MPRQSTAPTAPPNVAKNQPRPSENSRRILEDAITASGVSVPAERERLVARFAQLHQGSQQRFLRVHSAQARAEALLGYLHSAEGPLRTYVLRASGLDEALTTGHYNCVSATLLFNLLADALGLDVKVELLPTHARARLFTAPSHDGLVVETTAAAGVAPSALEQSRILTMMSAQGRASMQSSLAESSGVVRSIVPEHGMIAQTSALLGVILSNRASVAQSHGDLALAAQLFAQSEHFVAEPSVQQVLREQQASLLVSLAIEDLVDGDEHRLLRAHKNLKRAHALKPQYAPIRDSVSHNFRACLERRINLWASRGEHELLLRLVREELPSLGLLEEDSKAVEAFAFAELGRLWAERHDYAQAIAAIERGLLLAPDHHHPLRDVLNSNRVGLLRMWAHVYAAEGDWVRGLECLARLEPTTDAELKTLLAEDRRRVFVTAGQVLLTQGDNTAAVDLLRRGLRLFPADAHLKRALQNALEVQLPRTLTKTQCAHVKARVNEILSLGPSELGQSLKAYCQRTDSSAATHR